MFAIRSDQFVFDACDLFYLHLQSANNMIRHSTGSECTFVFPEKTYFPEFYWTNDEPTVIH